jgi:hypothetical protein
VGFVAFQEAVLQAVKSESPIPASFHIRNQAGSPWRSASLLSGLTTATLGVTTIQVAPLVRSQEHTK